MAKIGYGLIYGDMDLVFENESDRNEMALSCFQEEMYHVWALMQHCSWPFEMDVAQEASTAIFTTEIPLGDGEYGDKGYCVEAYYGNHVLTLCFADEAERNEMFMALYQEKEYEATMFYAHFQPEVGRGEIWDIVESEMYFYNAIFVKE